MFGEYSSLEKIPDISKWETNRVFYMNNLFSNCSALKEIPDISR